MTWYRERCWKRSVTAGVSSADCDCASAGSAPIAPNTAATHSAQHRALALRGSGNIAVAVWLETGRGQSRKAHNVMGIWSLTVMALRALNSALPTHHANEIRHAQFPQTPARDRRVR